MVEVWCKGGRVERCVGTKVQGEEGVSWRSEVAVGWDGVWVGQERESG